MRLLNGMTIKKIERLESFFDEDCIEEMLEECTVHCCHFNAANLCRTFSDWDCFGYVEGYVGESGHAICSYKDYDGNFHYFDPTQEWEIREGTRKRFIDEIEVIKEYTYDEINEIFLRDGKTHLISVNAVR